MFQFISRVFGGGAKQSAGRTGGVNASFQISEAFHRQFVTECRGYLDRLSEHQEQVFSRRVRNAIGDLCGATQAVLGRLVQKPDSISDVRELPSMLRRISEMLQAYLEISSPSDPLERTRNAEMCALLRGLKQSLRQTEQEMLTGAKIDLSALAQVLARSMDRANAQKEKH